MEACASRTEACKAGRGSTSDKEGVYTAKPAFQVLVHPGPDEGLLVDVWLLTLAVGSPRLDTPSLPPLACPLRPTLGGGPKKRVSASAT